MYNLNADFFRFNFLFWLLPMAAFQSNCRTQFWRRFLPSIRLFHVLLFVYLFVGFLLLRHRLLFSSFICVVDICNVIRIRHRQRFCQLHQLPFRAYVCGDCTSYCYAVLLQFCVIVKAFAYAFAHLSFPPFCFTCMHFGTRISSKKKFKTIARCQADMIIIQSGISFPHFIRSVELKFFLQMNNFFLHVIFVSFDRFIKGRRKKRV